MCVGGSKSDGEGKYRKVRSCYPIVGYCYFSVNSATACWKMMSRVEVEGEVITVGLLACTIPTLNIQPGH